MRHPGSRTRPQARSSTGTRSPGQSKISTRTAPGHNRGAALEQDQHISTGTQQPGRSKISTRKRETALEHWISNRNKDTPHDQRTRHQHRLVAHQESSRNLPGQHTGCYRLLRVFTDESCRYRQTVIHFPS